MTGKPVHEESSADWSARFSSGGWGTAGGNVQSLVFMRSAVNRIMASPARNLLASLSQPELLEDGRIAGVTAHIADYGCAEGDGTAYLASIFPFAHVTGYDFSPAAVERAQKRWPSLRFALGSLDEPAPCDILFSLHALEHTPDPGATLARLRSVAQWVVVVVPPLDPARHNGGHDGAPPTSSWLYDGMEGLAYYETYNTIRFLHDTEEAIAEGNVLAVLRGSLTPSP